MRRQASSQDGFTLLEVLIALTIFAVGSIGLVSSIRQSLIQESALEEKSAAVWVAQNRIAELRAGHAWVNLGSTTNETGMAQGTWRIVEKVELAGRPDLRHLEVDVWKASALSSTDPLVSLDTFIGQN